MIHSVFETYNTMSLYDSNYFSTDSLWRLRHLSYYRIGMSPFSCPLTSVPCSFNHHFTAASMSLSVLASQILLNLFIAMKQHPRGCQFETDEGVEKEVKCWLKEQVNNFYRQGVEKLTSQYGISVFMMNM